MERRVAAANAGIDYRRSGFVSMSIPFMIHSSALWQNEIMKTSYTGQRPHTLRGSCRWRWPSLIVLVMFFLTCVPVTFADDEEDDEEWLRLHEQVEAGRIKPLSDILDQVARDWVGDVIDVDIEEDDGITLYEIELLGPEGQVVEFEIDARTGEILEMEGRNIQDMRRP